MFYNRKLIKVLLGILILTLVTLNCNNATESQENFDTIKKGITPKEVNELIGAPTQKIKLGNVKATGDEINRWHYGNKAITFVGDSVIRKTSDQKRLNKEIEEMKEGSEQRK